jgi:hypothetical protein
MADLQVVHLNFDRDELEARYVCRLLEDCDYNSTTIRHLQRLKFTSDEDFIEIVADFYPDLLEEENV